VQLLNRERRVRIPYGDRPAVVLRLPPPARPARSRSVEFRHQGTLESWGAIPRAPQLVVGPSPSGSIVRISKNRNHRQEAKEQEQQARGTSRSCRRKWTRSQKRRLRTSPMTTAEKIAVEGLVTMIHETARAHRPTFHDWSEMTKSHRHIRAHAPGTTRSFCWRPPHCTGSTPSNGHPRKDRSSGFSGHEPLSYVSALYQGDGMLGSCIP